MCNSGLYCKLDVKFSISSAAPPFVTKVPQVDSVRPDSVRLIWRAGYDGNSAIQHFLVGYKFPGNQTEAVLPQKVTASGVIMKYVVPGLTPYTQYQFRIKAVNHVGHSPWSKYSRIIRTREAGESLISTLDLDNACTNAAMAAILV